MRVKSLVVLGLLLVAVLVGRNLLPEEASHPPQPSRPAPLVQQSADWKHIFLIVVDTLRRDHVSLYGDALRTPNMERLAAEGQVFDAATASFHQTTMSMAALFTGRTPSLEKSLDPQADQGPYDLQPDRLQGRLLGLAATLAEVRLYTLEGESLSSRKVLADFPRPSRLALDPVGGGVAYGQGFQVLFPRESPVQRQFHTYTAGLVGQDGYLYLVQGQALEVYDLVPSPPLFLRSLNLGFSPTTLAFIPVE